jgi:uncharacterized protein
MEVQLDAITAATAEIKLKVSPAELDLKLDLAALDTDVVYELTTRRVEDEVFLDGILTFVMKYTCARCLEEYTVPYRLPLNLVIQLVQSDSEAEEEEPDNDQFVIFPESKRVFSLDQHLRDLIALEQPMKPLCKSDCLGLCPQCGANLNETKCNCKTESGDPRWEALRKLYEN